MKATIEKIIEEICTLVTPLNPLQVKHIFDTYPEFYSLQSLSNLDPRSEMLLLFYNKALEGVKILNEMSELKRYQTEFTQYSVRGTVLQKELQELDEHCLLIQTEVNKSREKLSSIYSSYLLQIQCPPMAKEEKHDTPQAITQLEAEHIVAIRNALKNEIKLLTLPIKKLKLLQLKNEYNAKVAELHKCYELDHLDLVIPNTEHLTPWQQLQTKTANFLAKYSSLKTQLETLQIKLAERLSTEAAQAKILHLKIEENCLINDLEKIASQIINLPLKQLLKDQLLQELKDNPDIDSVILSYSNRIDTLFTYINPNSWFSWYGNITEYSDQQKEYAFIVEYLNLLKYQNSKQSEAAQIASQIEELSKISNPNITSGEEQTNLTAEVRKLLNELPYCKVPKDFTKPSIADYYLVLIDNISVIPDKISQYQAIGKIIDPLLCLVASIHQLRKDYYLPEEHDKFLPTIDELKQVIRTDDLLEQKHLQLKLSELYLDQLKHLTEQLEKRTEQTKYIEEKKKEILFNITVLGIALEKKSELEQNSSLAVQINSYDQELVVLQKDLSRQLIQLSMPMTKTNPTTKGSYLSPDATVGEMEHSEDLKQAGQYPLPKPNPQLPSGNLKDAENNLDLNTNNLIVSKALSPVKAESDKSIISTQSVIKITDTKRVDFKDKEQKSDPVKVVSAYETKVNTSILSSPTTHFEEINQLHQWHHANINALSNYPEAIKNWYYEVHAAVINVITTSSFSYQGFNLIKDIFFGLTIKKDIELLYCYQRLCPRPKDTLIPLLIFKLDSHPVQLTGGSNTANIPDPFQKLYKQCAKLARTYPIEAELLRQATDSLLCIFKDSNDKAAPKSNLILITKDPRYEPLKKHRGFLKIWEAIEDLFILIIGAIKKQDRGDYNKRPCFFKTKSMDLMEKAQTFVNKQIEVVACVS